MSILFAPEARSGQVPTHAPVQPEQLRGQSHLTVLLRAAGLILIDLANRRSRRPVTLKRLRCQDQHQEQSRDLAAQMYTWTLPR
ncbi:hypothetical protein [Arthrobacter sulfonylureivorans]|uniref:Uncharacterized protein n=1 Tax=Arthrobacter sulfonylureivorans TaxID=2486855 RepID=A0ABY3W5K2_9MICC|nr:hypothetical protein [Arthrobacter sulfonylureivorans]UNK45508.1 hypothetical protein MNQ99_16560 [Arthrobacter sulfonylureivorans]